MDAGAKKLLESVTFETLHAHQFSRSSTQATVVLTDLLSRYLTLLSTTCAKYAEHAGRLRLTAKDAVSALDELGVDVDELSQYCATEGREMSRYATHTARRIEDLHEFKAALSVGLKEDQHDNVPLVYAPVQSPMYSDEEEEEEQSDEEQDRLMKDLESIMKQDNASFAMDVNISPEETWESLPERLDTRMAQRQASPPLPLSPISNPSTPPRKRARTATWSPPPYIPSFLPPFPSEIPRHTPTPPPVPETQPSASIISPVKVETPEPGRSSTSNSTSDADYLTPLPYELSKLATEQPIWHLPVKPPTPPPTPSSHLPIPQIQPALFGAYHHVLTHPPPAHVGPVNPGRYKVALALVAQSEAHPRWDTPATLFGSTTPNAPRVAPIGPSYPVSIGRGPPKEKEGKEKGKDAEAETRLPPVPPRHVVATERIESLVSQQSSRIPGLARQLLPGSVFARTTRLTHPPVLQRGSQKLTYGPGVNAQWNAGPTPATTPAPSKGAKDGVNGLPNGKEAAPARVLPDARLYATWDWEQKHYAEPLPAGRRRLGSTHGGSYEGSARQHEGSRRPSGNVKIGGGRGRTESKG